MLSVGRCLLAAVLLATLGVAGLLGWRAHQVSAAYAAGLTRIDELHAFTSGETSLLSPGGFAKAEVDLQDLRLQLNRIEREIAIPVVEQFAPHVPWLGPRYSAARDVVRIGLVATHAATTLGQVGSDVLEAFDAGGLSNPPSGGSTWLHVLKLHQAQLASAHAALETDRPIPP